MPSITKAAALFRDNSHLEKAASKPSEGLPQCILPCQLQAHKLQCFLLDMIFCQPMVEFQKVEGSGDTQMPLLLMRSSYIALHYFTLPYTSHSYIKTDEVILQSCDVRCRPSLAFPVVSTQSKASEGKSTQSNATQSKARQPNPVNSGLVASLQFTSTMYARVIGTLMGVVEGSHFHVFDMI